MVEALGMWPRQLWTKVIFIPKRLGGWRPIGLLPALVHIHGKVRAPFVKSWEHWMHKPCFGVCEGIGSDTVVWSQAAWAEWANLKGLIAATLFFDLLKAFE